MRIELVMPTDMSNTMSLNPVDEGGQTFSDVQR